MARPLYRQLRDTIAAAILRGTYREGAQLPSVRALAAQYGVGLFVARGAAERLRKTECAAFLQAEWPALREKLALPGIPVSTLGEDIPAVNS